MHDIPGVSVTLLVILAGIFFNRREVSALRKDMLERFAKIDERFDKVDARFDKVDARFDKVDARFDKVDARLDKIDGRIIDLNRAIGHLEGRFEATKK